MTLYDHLGVSPEADFAELRRAYRHALQTLDPERYTTASPAVRAQAEAERRRVEAAWGILSNPRLRAEYDATLAPAGRGRPTTAAGAARGDRSRADHASTAPLGLKQALRLPPVQMTAVFLLIVAVIALEFAYTGDLAVTLLTILVLVVSFLAWAGRLLARE